MPLISDTRGVGRPVKQLNQAAARETIRFEHMLHGLVVGMRIRAHIAVMFDAPVDAVLRRTLGETRRGDPVMVTYGSSSSQAPSIFTYVGRCRTQCELGEHTFLAINRIDKQHGALRFDIVTNHFLTRELITPLRGIAIGGHQLAGMLINLQHGRQISHSGATEPPFRGNDALLTHLVHLCITLSSSERKNTMPTAQYSQYARKKTCNRTQIRPDGAQTRQS